MFKAQSHWQERNRAVDSLHDDAPRHPLSAFVTQQVLPHVRGDLGWLSGGQRLSILVARAAYTGLSDPLLWLPHLPDVQGLVLLSFF